MSHHFSCQHVETIQKILKFVLDYQFMFFNWPQYIIFLKLKSICGNKWVTLIIKISIIISIANQKVKSFSVLHLCQVEAWSWVGWGPLTGSSYGIILPLGARKILHSSPQTTNRLCSALFSNLTFSWFFVDFTSCISIPLISPFLPIHPLPLPPPAAPR